MSDNIKHLSGGLIAYLDSRNVITIDGEGTLGAGTEVHDVDELVKALRELELVQAERAALMDRYPADVQCDVTMVHSDGFEGHCRLAKRHLVDDSDHQDEHGCRAGVLVHQSTIREVERIQAARDAEHLTEDLPGYYGR
jgi:hypothetical protein